MNKEKPAGQRGEVSREAKCSRQKSCLCRELGSWIELLSYKIHMLRPYPHIPQKENLFGKRSLQILLVKLGLEGL
jgi:hypothetical protein